MKKTNLSPQDAQRIELKFECIRRNQEYRRDYVNLQRTHKRSPKKYAELESFFMPKWFHYPLLDPDKPIESYKKELGEQKYRAWLQQALGGLVYDDPRAPRPITVESPQIRHSYG